MPSHLQNLCLVSKGFNDIGTKFLYHKLTLQPRLDDQPIDPTYSYLGLLEDFRANPNLKWIRILSIHPSFYMSSLLEASLSCFIADIPDDCLERVEVDVRQPLKDLTIAAIWSHQRRIKNLGLNPANGSLLIEWAITGHKYLAQLMYLLELVELCNISWSTMDELVCSIELPRVKFLKLVSCDDDLFGHSYLGFYGLDLDLITHLSVNNMMMSPKSIIQLDEFPSLTHLALDQCSCIGPSLRVYKSPKLKDLRIRCLVSESTKLEVLESIRGLISRFNGLELLALDPSWPITTRYRPAWLRILLEISDNHSGTLRSLVIRERRWTPDNLEAHTAAFTAAKRCKALRLLEILTSRESRIRNLTVRCSPL